MSHESLLYSSTSKEQSWEVSLRTLVEGWNRSLEGLFRKPPLALQLEKVKGLFLYVKGVLYDESYLEYRFF